ncbi:hypothetical protein IW261DRAFT_1570671 [Armillaria novae-zelandiae]|uniref:Uncharacterized protein n=1 Tax=Armillaria novae-zelandiae TaxID=153914 RepID=A0AA39NWA0_9AGAR|nr:hypothetical protein IW261DRAFT_1570671 [Armillaria novae-zelandiae]
MVRFVYSLAPEVIPLFHTGTVVGRPRAILLSHTPPFFDHFTNNYKHSHASFVDTRSSEGTPPIITPELRHFRGSHRDLFRCVTTPNLETFHVKWKSSTAKSLLNVLDLFTRSGCSGLSKLALSNISITTHISALAVLQFQFSDWEKRAAEEDIFRSMFRPMMVEDEFRALRVVPNL